MGKCSNLPYQQDMDSAGRKLNVNGTVSGTNEYQAEVANTHANAQALKVKGKLKFQRGNDDCGFIEPISGGALSIQDGAGNECINIGNNITILGSTTLELGSISPESAITINGSSTRVESGYLQVDTSVNTHYVEPRNSSEALLLGTLNGAQVSIGRGGAQHPTDLTIINTQLHVAGTTEFSGNNVIVDHDLDVNGVLTGSMNNLDLNGNGDVSGNLTVHGTSNMEQGVNTEATLFVRHNSAFAQQPALDVVSSSVQTAIRATGPTVALTTSGRTDFGGDLRVNSNTVYLGGTTPTGTAIRANGTRIEFLIGGTVHFYIDSTGGHNA